MTNKNHNYKNFNEWTWENFSIPPKILNLKDFIIKNYDRGRIFHIGTDSKVYWKKTIFATALIAHNTATGGEIAIHKDKDLAEFSSLRQRLIMETMRTLETAWYLDSVLPPDGKIRLHIDVNNEIKFKSGHYKEELVGMIMGQGYVSYKDVKDDDHKKVVFWKPDSWAASSVADKRT